MNQNLTVTLDRDLVRKLRVLAAKRDTSISGLLREELKRLVERSDRYERAMKRAITTLARGYHLGGAPARREELHDRARLR